MTIRAATIGMGLALLAAMPAAAQPRPAEPVERFISTTLVPFSGRAEFDQYLSALRADERDRRWAHSGAIQLAALQAPATQRSDTPPPDPDIVIADLSAPPRNHSISTDPVRGVEDGATLRRIGRYLVALRDGRLFVVDLRAGGGSALAVVDRADVYRDPEGEGTHYEMHILGDRILVVGHSGGESGPELSLFRLGADGRLARDGAYHIAADQYYANEDDFAVRLAGDALVIHSSFALSNFEEQSFAMPAIRRAGAGGRGRALFEIGQVYRPVALLSDPAIHAVSVCPLAPLRTGAGLACRTTAFVAGTMTAWTVSAGAVLVWTVNRRELEAVPGAGCAPDLPFALGVTPPAFVYLIPLAGGAPGVAQARGSAVDRAFRMEDGRLRALLGWRPNRCAWAWNAPERLVYLDAPLTHFASRLADLPERLYTPLPAAGAPTTAARFTGRYLVYAGLSRRAHAPDEDDAYLQPTAAFAVPLDRPARPVRLAAPRTILRMERAGDDILLTGDAYGSGYEISYVSLRRAPRVTTLLVPGRYEAPGGQAAYGRWGTVIALPTSPHGFASHDGDRPRFAPDYSFFRQNAGGRLRPIGTLASRIAYEHDMGEFEAMPDYTCDPNFCGYWEQQAAPLLVDGRLFALTGAELIEARIERGRVREVQRLDIATASARR